MSPPPLLIAEFRDPDTLLAAERLPQARIHLFDTRPLDRDVGGDARQPLAPLP